VDLVNESNLEPAWLVTSLEPPAFSLLVVIKGTFRLVHDGTAVLADQQLVPTGDEYDETNPAKPLRYPMDFAPFKPRADLFVSGCGHAPGGVPIGGLHVSFRVGSLTKSLAVIGDRFWEARDRTTEPAPFTSMPLGWDRAYGGPGFEQNPIGKGYKAISRPDGSTRHPLPNIELESQLLSTRDQRVAPAGFGPVPDQWPQRLKKFGKPGGGYFKNRWPFFPDSLDWGFFNAAPEDQQVEGYLRGNEELVFENLHSMIPRFHSRLPGLRIRCFLNEQVRAHEELREVPMRLDTLWAQPDVEQLVLTWRGHLRIPSETLDELNHLLVVSEQLDAPTASAPSYVAVLGGALERRALEDDELEPEEEEEEEQDPEEAEQEQAEAPESSEPPEANPGDSAAWTGAPQPPAEEPEPADPEPPEAQEEIPDPDDTLTVDRVREKLARQESFENCDLTELDLAGFDFSGVNLREAILEGTSFFRANLSGADLTGAVLAGANLQEANCAGAKFTGADLTEGWLVCTNFVGVELTAADLTKSTGRGANFTGANASETIFEEADLSEAIFAKADLTSADLGKARLHRTDFSQANLTDASLEQTWGRQVKARGAILRKIRGANAQFSEGDFREVQAQESVWQFAQLYRANFAGARLDGAEFSVSYLSRATFDGAEMRAACLDGANLRRACLRRANLFTASLTKANLSNADFNEANLFGATLMDTTIHQTNWHGANLRRVKAKEQIV
jgi:uncharacterized protein YjbI with pentapeptide repeats